MARIETDADRQVRECLDGHRSFALVAGAGSGKTSSLIEALRHVRDRNGAGLRRKGQKVACLTYTKRAVEVIESRLGFDDLFLVSTLHAFLWRLIAGFNDDIRVALTEQRLPAQIARAREKSAEGTGRSKEALKAAARAASLTDDLAALTRVRSFRYVDAQFSDYQAGELSHDDVIEIAVYLLANNETFRRVVGFRFPYIFVDEAQDTFEGIVAGLNLIGSGGQLPLVGYFGDPWQQIYEGRAGDFAPPAGGLAITKTENFRCAESVIRFLNAFRTDVSQYAAGDNRGVEGSVEFRLIRAEQPGGARRTYLPEQLDRALASMDATLEHWGWKDRPDVVQLYLARQMIARRMKFADLNRLFTGEFASTRAQDEFESGDHFLVAPFLSSLCPLISARRRGDARGVVDVLRLRSPAFSLKSENASKPLSQVVEEAERLVGELDALWLQGNVGAVLRYAADNQLIEVSDRLREHLARPRRTEEFDEEVHGPEKGDWLVDGFFAMPVDQVSAYARFILENTPYSTQHGVKGEQYPKVLVLYDDVEASWNLYHFGKLLTPRTSGEPTAGQGERSRKLAYVSFSRAERDLRIILFTPEPQKAKAELVERYGVNAADIIADP